MRFMVSCEENNSQSRDGCRHPQKRHLQPPCHHSQISSSPSHGCSAIQWDSASPLEGIREEEAGALHDPERGTFPTRRGTGVTFGHEGWCSLFARVVKVTRLGLLQFQGLLE